MSPHLTSPQSRDSCKPETVLCSCSVPCTRRLPILPSLQSPRRHIITPPNAPNACEKFREDKSWQVQVKIFQKKLRGRGRHNPASPYNNILHETSHCRLPHEFVENALHSEYSTTLSPYAARTPSIIIVVSLGRCSGSSVNRRWCAWLGY